MSLTNYIIYIAFVVSSSFAMSHLSILTYSSSYDNLGFWVWILFGAVCIRFSRFEPFYSKKSIYTIRLMLSASIVFSALGFIVGLGHEGREAKLAAISSNLITYYLNFINIAILLASGIIIRGIQKNNPVEKLGSAWLLAIFMYATTTLSRSIVMYAVFLIFIIGIKIKFGLKGKLVLVSGLVLTLLFPIFQGRTDDAVFAILRSISNLLFYTGYSDYMSSHVINNQENYKGFLWGYIGVALTNPFARADFSWFYENAALYEFIDLGISPLYGALNANVVYPVWIGLITDSWLSILSFIFAFVLVLFLSRIFRLHLIYTYLIFRFFIIGVLVSPLILRDFVVEFAFIMILQLYLYRNTRGGFKSKVQYLPSSKVA